MFKRKRKATSVESLPQNRLYVWRDKQFGWSTLRIFVDFRANLDRDDAFSVRITDTLKSTHSAELVRVSTYPAYVAVQMTCSRQMVDALLDEVENYLVEQIAASLGWETLPAITRLRSDDEFFGAASRLGVVDLWRLGVTR